MPQKPGFRKNAEKAGNKLNLASGFRLYSRASRVNPACTSECTARFVETIPFSHNPSLVRIIRESQSSYVCAKSPSDTFRFLVVDRPFENRLRCCAEDAESDEP